MEESTTAAPYLPDELVVEILARLPAKSLCRFKCVSRRWRRLISDPANRGRLTQTLSGFFFASDDFSTYHLTTLPSSVTPLGGVGGGPPLVDAAFSFLPSSCEEIKLLDSCNGLLLLRCDNELYVVCNPATKEWVVLPQPSYPFYRREGTWSWYAAVGFDPAISSHFYVFHVVEEKGDDILRCFVKAVEVYSSETGTWVLSQCKPESLEFLGPMTYFNGSLHLPIEDEAVASLDPKGKSWRVTQVCEERRYGGGRGYVGHSQGRLIYVKNNPEDDVLSVYVHEDQGSREWTMKHNISKSDLLFEPWKHIMKPTYYIAGFHPDGDLVYFYDRTRKMLISYDMNRGDWHVLCTLEDFKHAHHPFFSVRPMVLRRIGITK